MPPKKRAKTDINGHAKCNLHGDSEVRKTICNGLKNDGQRCSHKIKRAVAETFLNDGMLPVCGVHKDQRLRIGYCEADAECGKRCNRMTRWKPPQNQLCEIHQDVQLTCHIMKLPIELRFMIIDLLIPDRDIGVMVFGFADAASLLRVNRQLFAETSKLVFQSQKRICIIHVKPESIRALGTTYEQSTLRVGPAGLQTHVTKFGFNNLARFSYFQILVDLEGSTLERTRFYALLENFQRVLYAIHPHVTGIGQDTRTQLAANSNTAPPRAIEFLDIQLKCHGFANSDSSASVPGKELERIFIVVRHLRSILKSILNKINTNKWALIVIVGSFYYRTNRIRYITDGEKVEVEGGEGNPSHIKAIKAQFKALRNIRRPTMIQETRVSRWELFQRICVLAVAFSRLEVLNNKQNKRGELYIRGFGDFAYQAERFMTLARYAHECGDVASLELMLDDFHKLWQEYLTRRAKTIDTVFTTLFEQSMVQGPDFETAQALDRMDRLKDLNWPAIRKAQEFPQDAEIELDGVYQCCRVDGKRIFRPLEPHLVDSPQRTDSSWESDDSF